MSLAMTFLRFVLAHELAHALQDGNAGSAVATEADADVTAATLVAMDSDLDGDLELIEAVASMSPEVLRLAYRASTNTIARRGYAIPELSDDELTDLNPASDEFLAQLDRFAAHSWSATAIAALMLVLHGTGHYRDVMADPVARVLAVIEQAFDPETLAGVRAELEDDTPLGMLRRVFVHPSA